MKEFVEASGVPFESFNILADSKRAERLRALGGRVPATVVGDRWAPGADLGAVAKLLDLPYDQRESLPPKELNWRYQVIMTTLAGFFLQSSEPVLQKRHPTRERSVLDIGHHAASVMRVFLTCYDPERYKGVQYELDFEARTPRGVKTGADLIARSVDTLVHFNRWWATDGHDDPLDQVVETYWGHQSLHAAFEREVWHTAQHARQVEALMREAGVTPTTPLDPMVLDGLPLPDRLFS
jgi:hypothetical protein